MINIAVTYKNNKGEKVALILNTEASIDMLKRGLEQPLIANGVDPNALDDILLSLRTWNTDIEQWEETTIPL